MSLRLCVDVTLVFFPPIIYLYIFFPHPQSDYAALVCATVSGDRGSRWSESSTSNFLPQLFSTELKVRSGERRLLFLYLTTFSHQEAELLEVDVFGKTFHRFHHWRRRQIVMEPLSLMPMLSPIPVKKTVCSLRAL